MHTIRSHLAFVLRRTVRHTGFMLVIVGLLLAVAGGADLERSWWMLCVAALVAAAGIVLWRWAREPRGRVGRGSREVWIAGIPIAVGPGRSDGAERACPSCAEPVEARSRFCPCCGAALTS